MRKVTIPALLFLVQASSAVDESPKLYRHAITFVHPHTSANLVHTTTPAEPQLMQPTNLQLPQGTDFGTFRLQYAYQNIFGSFSPWIALGGNLHKGFYDFKTPGNPQITEATTRVGLGLLAGIAYRFDWGKYFYLQPAVGYGHYFSSLVDIDLPQSGVVQGNGCHEICVTGSVDSLLYAAVVGLRLAPFLAFELGLEHNLFFSRRQQSLSDGVTTTTITQATAFSDALMFSFGLTWQFNLD